jgi:Fuc2NAc and GlcNAc transferase
VYKILAVYFTVFAVSLTGVYVFRRWSLKREILDIPNERSSHSLPTPRGGGLIICAVSILTFFIYSITAGESLEWPYIAGALAVAVISLVDDVRTLSPLIRILCHGAAAGLAVWSLGGFEWLWVPFYGIVRTGVFGDVLAFLWIVWLVNAYNFMDGIDGIAATQSITAGAGWFLTGMLWEIGDIGFYAGVLAVSSFGFLVFNWHPAKIFMGDVGSAFLGYSFAVLPLLAIKRMENPTAAGYLPWIAVVLVWFFVFDSVFTFLKRLFRGAKVWEPHREHIYQKLVIAGWSHSKVTGIYGVASAIIMFVLVLTLRFSWSFERTVCATLLIETVLLIIVRQKVLTAGKSPNFE